MVKIEKEFFEYRAKAICRPSGDHVGQQSPGLFVSWIDFCPPTTAA
jgi:hypothetical protein